MGSFFCVLLAGGIDIQESSTQTLYEIIPFISWLSEALSSIPHSVDVDTLSGTCSLHY